MICRVTKVMTILQLGGPSLNLPKPGQNQQKIRDRKTSRGGDKRNCFWCNMKYPPGSTITWQWKMDLRLYLLKMYSLMEMGNFQPAMRSFTGGHTVLQDQRSHGERMLEIHRISKRSHTSTHSWWIFLAFYVSLPEGNIHILWHFAWPEDELRNTHSSMFLVIRSPL